MDKCFRLGHHIWFVLHFDKNGKMNGLQEHDWREGGHLSNPVAPDTWEEMFIRNLRQRCDGEDFKDTVEKSAREFMVSDQKELRI